MGLSDSISRGEPGPVNEVQKENLRLINQSALHLTELVNEILDFSKIRAGKADLFLEKTRLEDIAATVVSLMKQSANATMSIATAGHPEPYLISSGNAMPVKSRGSIIGFMESYKYQSIMHFMNKGDIFLLYTDGLVDLIRNQHGAFNDPDFNAWEKFETRIGSIDPHLTLDEIIAHILKPPDRASFSQNRTEDDITIIAIKLT